MPGAVEAYASGDRGACSKCEAAARTKTPPAAQQPARNLLRARCLCRFRPRAQASVRSRPRDMLSSSTRARRRWKGQRRWIAHTPMSTSTRSNSGSWARSAATGMPDCATMRQDTVLSADGFAAGVRPLMTEPSSLPPRASAMDNSPALAAEFVFEHGMTRSFQFQFAFLLGTRGELRQRTVELAQRRARANVESNSAMAAAANLIGPSSMRRRSVSSARMRAISAASSSASWTSLLLSSTASSGSTNTVWPVGTRPVKPRPAPGGGRRHAQDHEAVVAQGDVSLRRALRHARAESDAASSGWCHARD